MNLTAGTLTTVGPDGKLTGTGLAASVEPAGEKRFVVKLKPDLKFSDGSPVKATDVVASFDYYIADKSNANSSLYDRIANVAAVDDLTVNFDLKQPDTFLPFTLSYWTSGIIPAKSLEAKGKDLYKADPPPTAGQFQIKSLATDQVTLTANSNYAGTQPTTKTLVFKKINDPAARLAQLQGGQLDFAEDISPKATGQLSEPVEARTAVAVNGTVFLTVNNRPTSVLSDVRIRQAIALAVDRNQINDIAFGGKDKPALGLFANASQYSHPFLPAKPDTGRAKELLAGTKCENGCSLNLLLKSTSDAWNDTAVVVQQNLKAIGIQSNVEKAEPSTISQRRKEGSYDLLVDSFYDDVDAPDLTSFFLFGPTDAYGSGYSSPKMGPILDRVYTTTGSEKVAAVEQLSALFEKDLPYVPLVDYVIVSGSRVSSSAFDLDPSFYYHVG